MARITLKVAAILRATASGIEKSRDYQWGHMGSCNCGFLAREITKLPKDHIHARAMQRYGDWNEQLNDYCPTSGLRMDDLISDMLEAGFDIDDLKHLERLSDPAVLRMLPLQERNMRHNDRHDVARYLRIWAEMIENELTGPVELPDIAKMPYRPAALRAET